MKQPLFLVCIFALVSVALAGGMFLPDQAPTDSIVGKNGKYDPTVGLQFAYASALAYCQPAQIKAWNCGAPCNNLTGFSTYYNFQAVITKYLSFSILTNDATQQVIFTFRGTTSDIEAFEEFTHGHGAPYTTAHFNAAGAEVLAYFQNTYKKTFQGLVLSKLEILGKSNRRNFQYIFTGHSLGAAFATLAALDASTYGSIPVTATSPFLMTYGSPRVGNYAFATNVSEVIPEAYRIVHYNDLFPHVPPCPGQSPISECKTPSSIFELGGVSDSYWYGWHLTQEIFYNENSSSYRACSQTDGEDKTCSDAIREYSYKAHQEYLGIPITESCAK